MLHRGIYDAAVFRAQRVVWSGKITLYSSSDDAMEVLYQRVNSLPSPFELEWHHLSGKPWDWKLARVSNPSFEIPAGNYSFLGFSRETIESHQSQCRQSDARTRSKLPRNGPMPSAISNQSSVEGDASSHRFYLPCAWRN
jgi:hypothetical protein